MEILRCIACLDPSDSFCKFNHGLLLRLAETYSHDFSTIDCQILKEQLHMFILYLRSTSQFSSCHDLGTLSCVQQGVVSVKLSLYKLNHKKLPILSAIVKTTTFDLLVAYCAKSRLSANGHKIRHGGPICKSLGGHVDFPT